MATGTDAGLLEGPKPQSIYKHGILEQYAIRYATMTASRLQPKRAVLFDGFAGRGRFDSGEAASAEHMMLAAQKVQASTQIDIFLVEKKKSDFSRLDEVAAEYRERGIRIETRNGDCEAFLAEAIGWADGASLFFFLDPCGAVIPFGNLAPLLRLRPLWPRTEFLINFSADLIRRAGGQLKKDQLDLGGVAAADQVCGGTWWRDLALRTHLDSGAVAWESAAEAVATEYARRITNNTAYGSVVAPVRRQLHHQPVYFLIFLTADNHGFWVFGAAAARAREKWLQALGPDQDELDAMLIPVNTITEQINREHQHAISTITMNLRRLTAAKEIVQVVNHTDEIFDGVYGEAKESAFQSALNQLIKAGEIEYAQKGTRPHKHVIRRVARTSSS